LQVIKNADADEMISFTKEKEKRTMLGNIPFEYGDYLIIPRGVIYQIDFETSANRLFYGFLRNSLNVIK
jgi:homogentisate 1,2-dioxygenase